MASKPSKFSSIFAPEDEPVIEAVATPAVTPVVEEQPTPAPEATPAPTQQTTAEQGSTPPRRLGRPATGKKSDPNYRQVSAYVRKDLYKNVSDALYDQSRGQVDAKRKEFSELVNELLEMWLDEHSNSDRRMA